MSDWIALFPCSSSSSFLLNALAWVRDPDAYIRYYDMGYMGRISANVFPSLVDSGNVGA